MTAPPSSTLPPVGDGDHVTGSDAPELTLVEYGDFGCPFCFAASRPVKSLLDRFDTLRLVWRHFPDPELHPGADLAAELSELAAVHGKFWEAHSLLLAGRERFSHEDLLSVARRLELDAERGRVGASRAHLSRARPRGRRRRQSRRASTARRRSSSDGERLEGHWRQLAQIVPGEARGGEAVSERRPSQSAPGVPETVDRDGAFPRLDEDQRARLRELGRVRTVEPGEVLFAAGDEGSDFFVIESGAVAIVQGLGEENRVIAVHGPHRFLGELEPAHRPAALSLGGRPRRRAR